jgi:glycosyltransferase involved in cell wall biosynthesis
VGTLAGLRKVKNLPRLVRAFAGLPANWKLVIVGEGPERSAIESVAASLGLSDRVVLPGFLARPERYVGLFDIFALSSDTEQFPISVVEAMAASVPVVSPSVGDVANMVSTPNAPLIAAKGDEETYARNMLTLAQDEALRARVGEANRLKALSEFDEAGMIDSYRRLYWRTMGRPAPRLR